jgi:hypothetical protein
MPIILVAQQQGFPLIKLAKKLKEESFQTGQYSNLYRFH